MADDWTPGTAALDLACPYCGAGPGDACQTASGRHAETHMARFEPLLGAFAAGYEEGRETQRLIDARRAGEPR